MLILPNYCLHSFVWCVWVRTARPCISCLPWLCFLVGLGLCVLVLFSSWGCRVLPFCCCCSLVLALLLPPLLSVLAAWVLAVWPALSWLPPFPPPLVVLWCFLVQSVLLVPPSGYLVVFATVRLSYLWHGVSWLLARVFPPLHGNKGFGLVWGFALSTMLWVLFMCPSLRRWGICPRVIQNPLWTPLKPYAPTLACAAFSFLPLLPSRASALSCLRVSTCLLPPAPSLCLVLPACLVVLCPGWCFWPPLFCGFGLVGWRGLVFCLGGLVWLPCVLVVSCCFLFVLAPRACWLCPTLVWTGTFVYFAFTCTTKALIDHCTCVSVHWLDSFTCTVEFYRSTTSFLFWFCVTIRWDWGD